MEPAAVTRAALDNACRRDWPKSAPRARPPLSTDLGLDQPSTLVEAVSTMSDINSRIAERVRSLRTDRQLSLEALASRCAVSRSMLSLIERGESSATAVVLEKIATGL